MLINLTRKVCLFYPQSVGVICYQIITCVVLTFEPRKILGRQYFTGLIRLAGYMSQLALTLEYNQVAVSHYLH